MRFKVFDKWDNPMVAEFDFQDPFRADQFVPLLGAGFNEIFVKGEYETENCKIKEGDIVVDIGGAVGMFSRWAASKGAGQIFSFEPDIQNFSCLVENAPSSCLPFNLGIMGKEGWYDLNLDRNRGGHSIADQRTDGGWKLGKKRKVYCITLQSLFDKGIIEKIDFMKIDTEGAERDILSNLPDEYFDKIDRIVMEWHSFCQPAGSLEEMLARLGKWYNYSLNVNGVNGSMTMCYLWKKSGVGIPKTKAVLGHASYIGHTGYNEHTRNFFRELAPLIHVKVRNYSHIPDQSYLDELDHKILLEQHWSEPPWKVGTPYDISAREETIDIVLAETNHLFFYDNYENGRRIAYNVWESTLYPDPFFQKLLEFDQLWVPSNWQRDCAVKQGFPEDRVKVVPEGVDGEVFHPLTDMGRLAETLRSLTGQNQMLPEYQDGRFKFIMFGRWDNRKSTTEIIQTFLKTFDEDEPVDLVVSIDNPFPEKWQKGKTTEECLKELGLDDPRIHVKHFPAFEEYVSYLQHGHVFVSCARSEGWNLPLIQAIACGIPTICSEYGAQLDFAADVSHLVHIKGMRPIKEMFMYDSPPPGEFAEPDFDHLRFVMRRVYEDYDNCKKDAEKKAYEVIEKFAWGNAAKIAMEHLNNLPPRVDVKPSEVVSLSYNFIRSPFVEIKGAIDKDFKIRFIDKTEEKELYSTVIKPNHWARANRQYYTDWRIVVETDGKPFFTHDLDLKDRRVLINMDSKAIGDTLAWFPYVEEFRKKHGCKVIASTFMNGLFKTPAYPELIFEEPGTTVEDLYAQYVLSYQFEWDADRTPVPDKSVPLQQVACNILGLDYEEIKPRIFIPPKETLWQGWQDDQVKFANCPKGQYVCLCEHSTARCKYWNYGGGWQAVVDHLKEQGYNVVVLGKENTHLKNVYKRTGNHPIEKAACYLSRAALYIGISAGLTWLAWAVNIPTILISGCTPKYNEFKETERNIRISPPEGICSGCMNDPDETFDRGDWAWCPHGNDFLCTRSITSQMVISAIDKILR